MFANRRPGAIARQWRAQIEYDIESGAPTVLHAGGGHFGALNPATLLALQALTAQRDDPAVPVVIAGGSPGQWPAALFSPQIAHARPAASPPIVLYGGEDPGTAMACTAAWVDGLAVSPQTPDVKAHWVFSPLAFPRGHAGMAVTWATLPMAVAHVSGGRLTAAPTPASVAIEPEPVVPQARPALAGVDGIGWAVILLAIGLPLVAMVI